MPSKVKDPPRNNPWFKHHTVELFGYAELRADVLIDSVVINTARQLDTIEMFDSVVRNIDLVLEPSWWTPWNCSTP